MNTIPGEVNVGSHTVIRSRIGNLTATYPFQYFKDASHTLSIMLGAMRPKRPANVLILGFGLGYGAQYLMDHMTKEHGVMPNITGVELSKDILHHPANVSGKDRRFAVVLGGAENFVWVSLLNGIKFDIVMVDIFLDDEKIPKPFTSQKFIGDLKGILSADGVIWYNTITAADRHAIAWGAFMHGLECRIDNYTMMDANRNVYIGRDIHARFPR